MLLKITQLVFKQARCDSCVWVFQMRLTSFCEFLRTWFEISHQHYGIFAIHTILYVAGYLVEKHQASMKVTDVLLNRKPEWHLEDTVVFPCLELKHELLLSVTVYFAFVFLHGCWNETMEHEWNSYDRLWMDNVRFYTFKLQQQHVYNTTYCIKKQHFCIYTVVYIAAF